MNLLEAVKMMRGPRGTQITIQILRAGWNQPKPSARRKTCRTR